MMTAAVRATNRTPRNIPTVFPRCLPVGSVSTTLPHVKNFSTELSSSSSSLAKVSKDAVVGHPIDFDITDCMHVQLVQSMTNMYAQIIGLAPI